MTRTDKIGFRANEDEFEIIRMHWKNFGYPKLKIGPFCRQQLLENAATKTKTFSATDQSNMDRVILELERQNGYLSKLVLTGFKDAPSELYEQIDQILHEGRALIDCIRNRFS